MTTELEKQFYKIFGIKPFCDLPCNKRGVEYTDNTYCGNKYPEITDRKLLEMICIVMKYKNTYRFVNGIEDLKEQTLKILISLKEMLSIYAEIQQLFKEGE